MAPAMATARLRKELVKLQKEPPPGVIAEPDESNILKWHYAVRGPSDTPYDGGIYIGKLVFPSEYPMKPPGILMLTPSGRFQVNTRLCMSMSDFHPESWNPMWSVAKIIQGVQSFMASEELTTGGMKAPASERKKLAGLSHAYNSKMFPNLFGGDIGAAFEVSEKARVEAEKKAASSASSSSTSNGPRRSRGRRAKTDKAPPLVDEESAAAGDDPKSQADQEQQKKLTEEEIEKRRKRNAKKRAKQKAKKAAGQTSTNEDGIVDDVQ